MHAKPCGQRVVAQPIVFSSPIVAIRSVVQRHQCIPVPGAVPADADSGGTCCNSRRRGACRRGYRSRRGWARRRWSVGGCRCGHRSRHWCGRWYRGCRWCGHKGIGRLCGGADGNCCRRHGGLATASAGNNHEHNGQAGNAPQTVDALYHCIHQKPKPLLLTSITIDRGNNRIITSPRLRGAARRSISTAQPCRPAVTPAGKSACLRKAGLCPPDMLEVLWGVILGQRLVT